MHSHTLTHRLILIVVFKLIVLFALWWVFVRDQGVTVNATGMAQAIQSIKLGEPEHGH